MGNGDRDWFLNSHSDLLIWTLSLSPNPVWFALKAPGTDLESSGLEVLILGLSIPGMLGTIAETFLLLLT